ncbi:MAG: cytochrome c oxidase subunit 3, partial [Gemmatimonadales bacterium]
MTAPKVALAPTPARTGVWVGIAAITMMFAAYTSAMLVRQGAAPDWTSIHLPGILYFNTLVLLV